MKKSIILALALLAAVPAYAADGDATHGEALFKAQCNMCHKADKNSIGPQLGGVFGRKAGMAAGFSYSDAVKASGLTWDEATLDKWLTGPSGLVAGTKMMFKVPAEQDRSDIIAYLKTVK